jgi:DNA-binding response OmpR family regulator
MQILMVDDDLELQSLMVELLAREGMQVSSATTLDQANRHMQTHPAPSVVILDLMLPDGNGLDLCKRWRMQGLPSAILMLTARGDEFDRVLGLEMGADDYLSKPFSPRELVARIRALVQRHSTTPNTLLRFEGLTLDLLAHRALSQGQSLELTSNEFRLLAALATRAGQVQSRAALSAAIQPGGYSPLDRTVDVQIGRLRRKLPLKNDDSEWIITLRGEGYLFNGRAL